MPLVFYTNNLGINTMLKLTKKASEYTKKFGNWIAENSVEIIWSLISIICAGMAVLLYRISGEFINTFTAFFE